MVDRYEHQLHQLQLSCRHRVNHQMSGLYRSIFKGQGVEFDEVRAYTPGDDVRAIDWNITARTGQVHIKRFHEERQLNLVFVMDNSPSFAWSSQSQSRQQVACEFVGLLGTAALNNNDRMGLLKFSQGVDHYLPPTAGQSQLMRCLGAMMEAPEPVSETSVLSALEHLNRLKLKRSIIIILSDFFFDDFIEPLAVLNRHHDVISIAIDDPRECSFQGGGLVKLRDVENNRQQWLDLSSRQVRKKFQEQVKERFYLRTSQFDRWGLDLLCHTMGDDPVETLLSYLLARKHRIAGETGG